MMLCCNERLNSLVRNSTRSFAVVQQPSQQDLCNLFTAMALNNGTHMIARAVEVKSIRILLLFAKMFLISPTAAPIGVASLSPGNCFSSSNIAGSRPDASDVRKYIRNALLSSSRRRSIGQTLCANTRRYKQEPGGRQ